jgi:hypothetical protein
MAVLPIYDGPAYQPTSQVTFYVIFLIELLYISGTTILLHVSTSEEASTSIPFDLALFLTLTDRHDTIEIVIADINAS